MSILHFKTFKSLSSTKQKACKKENKSGSITTELVKETAQTERHNYYWTPSCSDLMTRAIALSAGTLSLLEVVLEGGGFTLVSANRNIRTVVLGQQIY